jgi:hypothetical protein
MRAAPPLALALGSGRPERAAVAVLAGASAACATAWALWHAATQGVLAWWPAMVAVPAAAALAAGLAWRLVRPLQGGLCWNGRAWQWQQAAVQVEPAIDLGRWLLLRLHLPAGAVRWVGLGRAQVGAANWHALRATLYAAGPGQGSTAEASAP